MLMEQEDPLRRVEKYAEQTFDRRRYSRLSANWCRMEITLGTSLSSPGIYRWSIEGVGTYIGKYTSANRPLRHYARNVARLLHKLAYRRANPDGYRRVHRELALAVQRGRAVTLTILENPPLAELNRRESELIRQWGSLNDPPYGKRT